MLPCPGRSSAGRMCRRSADRGSKWVKGCCVQWRCSTTQLEPPCCRRHMHGQLLRRSRGPGWGRGPTWCIRTGLLSSGSDGTTLHPRKACNRKPKCLQGPHLPFNVAAAAARAAGLLGSAAAGAGANHAQARLGRLQLGAAQRARPSQGGSRRGLQGLCAPGRREQRPPGGQQACRPAGQRADAGCCCHVRCPTVPACGSWHRKGGRFQDTQEMAGRVGAMWSN